MLVNGTSDAATDAQLREHLVTAHGWTALDLLAHGHEAPAIHRFEHFEESAGLIALDHDHDNVRTSDRSGR
jgi:hypothetical protein